MQRSPAPDDGPLRALAAAVSACGACLFVEGVAMGAAAAPVRLLDLAGLGAGMGVLLAAPTGVWLRLGARLGGKRAFEGLHGVFVGALPGAALALWMVLELQALPKLHHAKHAPLALGALCAAAALGCVVALAVRARGRGDARPWVAAAIVLAGVGLLVSERNVLAATYPGFHFGMRLLGLWLLAGGAALAWRRGRGAARIALAVGAALLLSTLVRHVHWGPGLSALGRQPIAWAAVRGLRAAADLDGDGHASILGGGDCAPLDRAVHPAAVEVVGNGVDDNCRLGDRRAETAGASATRRPQPPAARARNVVLITVDALRPDRMSAYGYERDTTPHVARFFASGTRYTNAFTAGGGTSIAIPALLRGREPAALRLTQLAQSNLLRLHARADGEPRLQPGEYLVGDYLLAMHDPHPTLADKLSQRGLSTLAAVDDGLSQLLARGRGADVGFDGYRSAQSDDYWSCEDAQTAQLAISALSQLPHGRPYFLWMHLYGPHLPSVWHGGAPRFGNTEPDRYDHEVAFADMQIGRLLSALRARGELDATLVVLTADHGENFWGDWERNHSTNLHAAAIRVPLLVRGPGFGRAVVRHPVGIVDVAPTILAATDAAEAPDAAGTTDDESNEGDAALDGVALQRFDGVRVRPLRVETVGISPSGAVRFDYVGVVQGEHLAWLELVEQRSWFGRHDDRGQPPTDRFGHPARAELLHALHRALERRPGVIAQTAAATTAP